MKRKKQDDIARLVVSIREGRTSFEELIRLYQNLLWRTVYQIVGNRHDAEDIVQETFVKVYTHLDSYDPSRPFEPWIRKIAVHETFNMLKKKKVRRRTLERYTQGKARDNRSAEAAPKQNRLVRRIHQLLSRLKPLHRIAFTLYYMEHLSVGEISESIGSKPGTVKSYLFRARRAIGKELRMEGVELQ